MLNDSPDFSRAVFFDRDGTLAHDVPYNGDPAQVRLFDGVPAALRELKNAGWKIIIVTNQSGIGRGLISEEHYQAVNAEFVRQCVGGAGTGEIIDAVYHAPDHPESATERRKPGAEMLREAAKDHHISLKHSWMIGDKLTDVEAGLAAGTRVIGIAPDDADPPVFHENIPVFPHVTQAIAHVLSEFP